MNKILRLLRGLSGLKSQVHYSLGNILRQKHHSREHRLHFSYWLQLDLLIVRDRLSPKLGRCDEQKHHECFPLVVYPGFKSIGSYYSLRDGGNHWDDFEQLGHDLRLSETGAFRGLGGQG